MELATSEAGRSSLIFGLLGNPLLANLPGWPTGYGDSPYQVFSSFAGNPYFIDWDPLINLGLVREDELSSLAELPAHEVDYGRLYDEFFSCARLAFSRFPQAKDDLEALYGNLEHFLHENDSWLTSYACFQVLKGREQGKPWWKWSDGSKQADSRFLQELRNEPEFSFHVFLQYLFWSQWKSLRSYANGKTFPFWGTFPFMRRPILPRSGKAGSFSGCLGLRFFPRGGRAARLFQ